MLTGTLLDEFVINFEKYVCTNNIFNNGKEKPTLKITITKNLSEVQNIIRAKKITEMEFLTECKNLNGLFMIFQDNGPGFQYSTTQKGYGLKFIKRLVKNRKGVLVYKNNSGSCFFIYFPTYEMELNF